MSVLGIDAIRVLVDDDVVTCDGGVLSKQFRPAGLELRLADRWLVGGEWVSADHMVLAAGEMVVCSSVEFVDVPHGMIARVEGCGMSRVGLWVRSCYGLLDHHFRNHVNLELVNVSGRSIDLYAGDRFCQLVFESVDSSTTDDNDDDGGGGVCCGGCQSDITKSDENGGSDFNSEIYDVLIDIRDLLCDLYDSDINDDDSLTELDEFVERLFEKDFAVQKKICNKLDVQKELLDEVCSSIWGLYGEQDS